MFPNLRFDSPIYRALHPWHDIESIGPLHDLVKCDNVFRFGKQIVNLEGFKDTFNAKIATYYLDRFRDTRNIGQRCKNLKLCLQNEQPDIAVRWECAYNVLLLLVFLQTDARRDDCSTIRIISHKWFLMGNKMVRAIGQVTVSVCELSLYRDT